MSPNQKWSLIGSACLFIILLLAQGCQSDGTSSSVVDAQFNSTMTARSLGSGIYASGSDTASYELFELTENDGQKTYVQWFAPTGSVPGPAVIAAEPYYGIDWSENAVDADWAARPNAATGINAPDIYGPGYVAGVTKNVSYQKMPPTSVPDQEAPLLLNHAGVLIIYGRFYAGGTFKTYYESVVTGLRFLRQQSTVDPERIGVFGISLGGFEAIYGAAHAPADIVPKYGVAWAPPLDMTDLLDYVTHLNSKFTSNSASLLWAQNFFEPYVRRITAVTHGLPGAAGADFSTLVPSTGLLPTLRTQFLLLHDDWDLLIPAPANRAFVAASNGRVEGLWFPHQTAIDYNTFSVNHAQPSEGLTYLTPIMLSDIYLLTRLSTESSLRFWFSDADANTTFSYFRAMQVAGQDVSTLTPRLIDMCDPRISFTRTSNLQTLSGPAMVALILQTHWGANSTAINASTVKTYLQQNGLPN